MSGERRRAPRLAERIPVTMTDDGSTFHTETQNISLSGAYCTLDRFIPPMTKLQLDCELPMKTKPVRIQCAGIVVRVEPVITATARALYHLAIFFTELSTRDKSALARFIRQRVAHKMPAKTSRTALAA